MFTRAFAIVVVVVVAVAADKLTRMVLTLHILQNYHLDPIRLLHLEPIHRDPTPHCLLRSILRDYLSPILHYHPILNRGCKVVCLERKAAEGHCSTASSCSPH